MKTIIVATDFSPAAQNATEYAMNMAMAVKADLLLLHTCELSAMYSDALVITNFDTIQKTTEQDLADLKSRLLANSNNKLAIETEFRFGGFYTELSAVCERVKPYAVVMGSQGTTGAERVLFGTHSVHAMKHLAWPLVAVPPDVVFSGIKKIGLAYDFKEPATHVPVDAIKALMTDFKAELHVLNTDMPGKYNSEIVFESGVLRELVAPFELNYHLMESEDVDGSIMEFAEKIQADLLIVLPKRHDLVDRIIHKSHTKQFVLHSHVPVMSLHFQ